MPKTTKKAQKRILVVEDDFFLIKVLQTKLQQAGFDVQIAADGVIALEILRGGFSPDIMLLDLVMPRKDGFEVLDEMSQEKGLKNIHVIVLSNLGQESDIERVKALGVHDYLVKSDMAIDDVVTVVKKALKMK